MGNGTCMEGIDLLYWIINLFKGEKENLIDICTPFSPLEKKKINTIKYDTLFTSILNKKKTQYL